MWLLLPLCTVLYQFAAKQTGSCWQGAGAIGALTCMLHEPWLRVMVLSDVGGFVAWMYVLRHMNLSAAFPMTAISYVIVMFISWLVFRETADTAKIAGSALIIAGVFLIGRARNAKA
jgi:drug/metabolite transporter (DMT)-like permease